MPRLRALVTSVADGDVVVVWPSLLAAIAVGVASYFVGPNRGDVRVDVAMARMAAFLVTFMILLRKLDRLHWHEVVTIWEPTTRLFRNMGRDPYVPREVIENGRYGPTGRVCVVEYPDPYPIRSSKIVKVEELDGKRERRGFVTLPAEQPNLTWSGTGLTAHCDERRVAVKWKRRYPPPHRR
jgi:hypothetical protein